MEILIRASALHNIMGSAKSKRSEDLSAGALSYCLELAKQHVYDYEVSVSSKYLDKGLIVEDQSIDLYNSVFFTNYKKNTKRINTKYLTGECDIDAPEKIIDVKSSWSLSSFPAIVDSAHEIKYEWQGRAYMHLYNKHLFELAYCMVDTPEDLISYEDSRPHIVGHIEPNMRITRKLYERDYDKEDLIITKCIAAQRKVKEFIEQIIEDHKQQ